MEKYTRFKHAKAIFGVWWIIATCLWSTISSADTFIGKLAPQRFQSAWGSWWLTLLWGWKMWIIGILTITLISVFFSSYACIKKREHTREKAELELKRQLEDLGAKFQGIPGPELRIAYDTQIVDLMRWPLAIQNIKGGTAYRVKVDGVRYGSFSAHLQEIAMIKEGDTDYCQSSDNTNRYGSLLRAITEYATDLSVQIEIPITVSCEDSSNRKFVHFFDLIYKKRGIPRFLPKGRMVLP